MLDDLFRKRENAKEFLKKTFGIIQFNRLKAVLPRGEGIEQLAFNFTANLIDRASLLDDSQRMNFWNDTMEEMEESDTDNIPLLAFICGMTMMSLYAPEKQ